MTMEFRCADAGATPCGWSVEAGSEEELEREVVEHLRTKHRVEPVSQTLVGYVKRVARER